MLFVYVIGRVFLALLTALAALILFWWVFSTDWSAYLIVAGRMVEGFSYFWLCRLLLLPRPAE